MDENELKQLMQAREELDRKIEEVRKQARAEAIAKARAIIADFGLAVGDLFPSGRARRSASKGEPKFRDPATGKTWTGKGKPPLWIVGQDREKFRIAA